MRKPLIVMLVLCFGSVAQGRQTPEPEIKAVTGVTESPAVSVAGPSGPSLARKTQGWGENPQMYKEPGGHNGEDRANKCGEQVTSPTRGRVTSTGNAPDSYGTHLYITGYDGWVHLLGHTEPSVKTGDSVAIGTPVGTTNSTGHSTACHLHWSTLKAGKFIDPEVWKKEPVMCPNLFDVPATWGVEICSASVKYGADPSLVASLIWVENRGWPAFNKNVCSSAGACGIGQFIAPTFKAYGVDGDGDGAADRASWRDSVHSTANYVASMKKCNGEVRCASVEYNAGGKYYNQPDSRLPAETRQYIGLVSERYAAFRK